MAFFADLAENVECVATTAKFTAYVGWQNWSPEPQSSIKELSVRPREVHWQTSESVVLCEKRSRNRRVIYAYRTKGQALCKS